VDGLTTMQHAKTLISWMILNTRNVEYLPLLKELLDVADELESNETLLSKKINEKVKGNTLFKEKEVEGGTRHD